MNFTFYLFKRFFRNNGVSSRKNVFSAIVISGIAIGVTALLIALSVLGGFKKVLAAKLSDLDSHLQLIGFSDNNLPYVNENIADISKLLGSNFKSADASVVKSVIISFGDFNDGVSVKGVDKNYFGNKTSLKIVTGSPDLQERSVVIGKNLAFKMGAVIGSKITLFYLANNSTEFNIENGGIEQFTVTGIFETGMSKYDDNFVYININRARELFNIPAGFASVIEIKLNSVAGIDSITQYLQDELSYPYYVRNVYELNRSIFTWIELQQKPIPVILGLITLVAAFNIISTILMTVLEKTRRIGILRALGMKRKRVLNIFLLFGTYHGIVGTLLGNVLALVLIFIQTTFNVIKLPSSIYFISEVPFDLRLEIFLLVSGISIALNILMSLVPSFSATRISPLSAIRFK